MQSQEIISFLGKHKLTIFMGYDINQAVEN